MTTANLARIELVSSPPCEQFRSRFPTKPRQDTRAAAPPPRLVAASAITANDKRSIAAFISAAALVGFATNLSMHLLNLRMQHLGLSELAIGVSVAIQALGIVVVAPVTKHVIARCGVRQTLIIGALLCAATLTAFGFIHQLYIWDGMRFVFATGLALLFTSSESLVISRAGAANRGRLVGWYATALATGTTAGPLLIAVIGVQGLAPLLWSAAIFGAATTPMIAFLKHGEQLAPVVRKSTFATLRFAPVAFLSAFVFGALDNGGMSMLSVYSVLTGYDYVSAVTIAVFATIGGIVLQIPLGIIASRNEPRMILLYCGLGLVNLLTLLPNVMAVKPAAFAVTFCFGGLLEGLYTVSLICLTKYYRGIGISSANGCFVAMCGFGELVGPLATGTSMNYLGPGGFVVGLTTTLAVYCILLVAGTNSTTAPSKLATAA
jgi:predicted MFS family arabinose efflux permease